MDSVAIGNEAASSNNDKIQLSSTDPSEIGSEKLFKAAADGDIEPFKKSVEQLDLIVTPVKNTVLHINIRSEKVSTKFVEEILETFPSLLLQVNAQGDTPLHVAVKFKCGDVVEALIKCARAQHDQEVENGIGAVRQMLRMKNKKRNTALHEAMRNHSIDVVETYVKEDPDYPYSTNHCGETPLYIAAENAFFKGVVKMLETKKSVDHEGPNGKTVLHAAVMMNFPDLTREILEKKENLTKEVDDNGWTPLHCAAYYGFRLVSQILLESDKSAVYVGDKYRKMTPLHLAASQGHIDIIKDIMLFCPDCYDLVDDREWNVLHFAMATMRKKELLIVAENPLIRRLVHEKDAKGNTPLHVFAALNSDDQDVFDDVRKEFGGKNAFNKRNVSAFSIIDFGCPELKKEILELSDAKDGPYQGGVIRRNLFLDEKDINDIEKRKDSHLVVAALIATVTFAAAFTLPGGFKNEEGSDKGTAILSKKSAFQAFVITNSIAMVLSITAVFHNFVMSVGFQKYVFLLSHASYYSLVAMGSMVVAFITGSYAVLSPSLGLSIVTIFIGLTFFLLVLYMFHRLGKELS
ncbi:hypothetical protein QYF36_010801 [Acer negundo]|nr:hypothetical protein QYF36_010801 [Acer negundo]